MSFYKMSIGNIGSGYVESIKENDELINETTLYMLRGYCFSNSIFYITFLSASSLQKNKSKFLLSFLSFLIRYLYLCASYKKA